MTIRDALAALIDANRTKTVTQVQHDGESVTSMLFSTSEEIADAILARYTVTARDSPRDRGYPATGPGLEYRELGAYLAANRYVPTRRITTRPTEETSPDRDALAELIHGGTLPWPTTTIGDACARDVAYSRADRVIAAGWRPFRVFETEAERNAAMASCTDGQRPVVIVGDRLCRWGWNPRLGEWEWQYVGSVEDAW